MSKTVHLADYLFARLKQLGVGAVHGVPGDYNLALLDYVEPSGLLWVGNANELNAGYAADGYARMKGVGALITTFGVGELSAMNAIACAYTERAAVVHIVGTPQRNSQDNRVMVHHTMTDGDYRHFGQMAEHVTAAQTRLVTPLTAPEQIDATLQQCLLHSRPVYIEFPVDMVGISVPADRLETKIAVPEALHDPGHDDTLKNVLEKIYAAKQPAILVDGDTRPLGIMQSVQRIVNTTKWPTFTSGFGKSLIDMTAPNVHGIYQGMFADSKVKSFMEGADLVLCFGPHFSTTNSYNFSAVPKPSTAIYFTQAGVKIGDSLTRDLPAAQALSSILDKLDTSKAQQVYKDAYPDLPHDSDRKLSFADINKDEEIQHSKLWGLMADFFRPGDAILCDTGTSAYGIRLMPLPNPSRLFLPATWLSIGYMLPASQGVALAQRELREVASGTTNGSVDNGAQGERPTKRTVLVIGDGSFQMTVQELATIVQHNLNVIVFVINNDGFTIERCIHGKNQRYNDIPRWRYMAAPRLFGAAEDAFTAQVRTYGELEKVLSSEKLVNGQGLRMVEVFMDKMDAPEGPLKAMLDMQKDAN